MSISIGSSFFSTPSPASATGASKGTPSKPLQKTSVEDAFLKEVKKTPAERLRESLLEQMGLTEEALAAMDPDARAAVERTIADAIKQRLQAGDDQSTGQVVDRSI
jgi:TPP-dependent pyruvate/acetoin dehydrogenase alpha subunit